MNPKALVIAGLGSQVGKTLVTAALTRHFAPHSKAVKLGPDYIDRGFYSPPHSSPPADGSPSQSSLSQGSHPQALNLDLWAMSEPLQAYVLAQSKSPLTLFEGMMGLFDGKFFTTAQAAQKLGVGIVLVLDMCHTAQTPVYLAKAVGEMLASSNGLASNGASLDGAGSNKPTSKAPKGTSPKGTKGTTLKGVIFNNLKSPNHRTLACQAAEELGIKVLGCIYQTHALASRHLGLVQATEQNQATKLAELTAHIATQLDTKALWELADEFNPPPAPFPAFTKPADHIAVASDNAFGFIYPWLLEGWRRDGAKISPFSPLRDEAPDPKTDFIYLPGGYPELYPELGNCETFRQGVRKAVLTNKARIYGECGGYMMLGDAITTSRHTVRGLGLLGFSSKVGSTLKALGYRKVVASDQRLGIKGAWRGHEFHYGEIIGGEVTGGEITAGEITSGKATNGKKHKTPKHKTPAGNATANKATPLFTDEAGNPYGIVAGNIAGSFIHLIDSAIV